MLWHIGAAARGANGWVAKGAKALKQILTERMDAMETRCEITKYEGGVGFDHLCDGA